MLAFAVSLPSFTSAESEISLGKQPLCSKLAGYNTARLNIGSIRAIWVNMAVSPFMYALGGNPTLVADVLRF